MPPRAGNGFTQHAAHGAAPCTSRTCAVGRIQPFRPGGTFEAFGRTARDIGQSTPYCPKPGSEGLLTKSHHRGVRAAARLLTNHHFSPGARQIGSVGEDFSSIWLKPSPMLGLMRLSGFCRDGSPSPRRARVSETCSQTLTMHLTTRAVAGFWAYSRLKHSLPVCSG
jgi:hypothetical protein